MKKKSLLFLLLFALMAPWAAKAQSELTVYDGSATNGNVPVYGWYADAYNKAEMIMPAADLDEMTGGTISKMTWYLSSPAVEAWGANYQVYLKEVDNTTFTTTFLGVDGATLVWEGPLDGTGSTIEIEFDNNYTYGGGNLFIAVYQTATGTYKSAQFAGEAVTSASISNYSYSGLDDITSGTASDFLPKTTFEYAPAGGGPTCEKPATFEVTDITGYAATCTWESEVGNYTFEWKKASETDWTVVSGLTATTYQLDNLEPYTAYSVRVKAVCDTDLESAYKTANFTTLDVCPDGLVCIGEGTATNSYLPTYFFYNYSLTEQIYTADEIGTAGAIESVDIYSVGTGTRTLEIYMVSTEKRAFEGDDWIPATASDLVFSGEVTFAANSWNTFEFDNPFIYNGTSNVALIVRDMTGSYVNGINFFVFDAPSQALYAYRDASEYDLAAPGVTGTVLSVKNRVRFAIGEPPACPKPMGITAEVTGNQAVISWTSDAASFNIDINGTVIENVTNPYTFTGDLATTYEVMVQANCGGDGLSEWTNPVSFTTDLCMPEDQCTLTFVVTDSYGDGWNGASIDIYDYTGKEIGDLLASITNQNLDGTTGAETQTLTYNFCNGQELAIIWMEGGDDSECSYTITDLNGDIVAQNDVELAMAYTMNCTVSDCRRPTDFVASEIGPHSVVLSWTENGPATSWVLAYISENDEDITEITVNTNPYTLTGLTPETMYAAQVTPVCELEKPSEVVYWTTTEACPKPSDLTVTPYPTTADVTWTGFGEGYTIEWAEYVPYTPSNNALWLQYDDDTYATSIGNSSARTWTWGVMYPASMLEGYTYLNKVGIYENSYYDMDSYTVNIYTGGDDAPETLVGTQTVIPTANGMHEINLAEPVTIDPTQNLWITVTGYGTYILNSCETTEPNNQWVLNSGTWANIGDLSSSLAGYGWMIRGFIDNIAPTYDWNTVSGVASPYTIIGLEAETDYIVRVKADCGQDGLSGWTYATFTTPSACDVPVDLEATDITYNAATLNWVGYQNSYNLRWWSPAHVLEFNANDFTQVGEDYIANSVMQTYTISLSGFSGVGNVAIRHYNISDMFRLNIDDIVLTNAQGEVIASEDFESGEISMNWVNYDLDGDGYTWDIWNITSQDANGNDVGNGSYCATSASYNSSGALNPDNWLIIPNVELGGTLTFVARGQDPAWAAEVFGVFVSTNQLVVPGTDPVTVNNVTMPYELTGLNPETPYAWQVQGINANCADGIEWSEIATFTTPEQTTLTQTIELTAGVNYVSFFVETNLDDLKAALVDALGTSATIIVKSRVASTKYQRGRWAGNLSELNMAEMYKIDVPTDCEISLVGMPIDPTTLSVTITPGANWIAYPYTVEMTLPEFFGSFPVNNDVVKSKSQNSKYNRGRWAGSLTGLVPGQGYIYVSADEDAEGRVFTFPASAKAAPKATPKATQTPKMMDQSMFKPRTVDIDL